MKKTSLILVACIILMSIFALAPRADEKTEYFALGDSIAAGYGLASPDTESYPALIAKNTGLTLQNLAVSGDASVDMLRIIENTPSIKDAKLITISMGGNDIIGNSSKFLCAALIEKLTTSNIIDRNAAIGIIRFFAQSSNISTSVFDINRVNFDTLDADIETIFEDLSRNLAVSIKLLRLNNADAEIIVQTLYNPYMNTSYEILNYNAGELIDKFIDRINEIYSTVNAELGNTFDIVDIAANMNGHTEYFYTNWDFHPTKAGHGYIAGALSDAYNAKAANASTTDTTPTTAATATVATTATAGTTATVAVIQTTTDSETTYPATTTTATTTWVLTEETKATAASITVSTTARMEATITTAATTTAPESVPTGGEPPSPAEPSEDGLQKGAIVGITLIIAFAAAIIFVIATIVKKKK